MFTLKKFLLITAAAAVVGIGAALVWTHYQAGNINEAAAQSVNTEAPDITVTAMDGTEVKLSSLRGKTVFVNFWATWCSNCVKEMPAIEKLYEEYGDQIVIVGVNVGEDEDTIDTFIEAKNYSFPVACDTESNISNLYPSAGIPYTVIVGKDGLVTETFLGAKDADSQYTKLRRALQEAYEAN